MAFTSDQVQGVFGEFTAVIDESGGILTSDQVQGVFGEFNPVLDDAQVLAAAGIEWPVFQSRGFRSPRFS